MRRAAKSLYERAGVPLVQTVQQAEGISLISSSYRIFWLETESQPTLRKLYIQPPGTAPYRAVRGHKGHVITFPEELLLLFGLGQVHPFRLTAAIPPPSIIGIDIEDTAVAKAIEQTIANLSGQCCRLPKGHIILTGLLKVLLVSISRLFQDADRDRVNCADRQIFERFMDLISQHNVGKNGIQGYAKKLSIRAELLSEAIKRVSGFPASHHIYQHIIRTAKHAAMGSSSTMKEVAFGLGFKDVAHFSKFFRNKAGMTFSDYKRASQFL